MTTSRHFHAFAFLGLFGLFLASHAAAEAQAKVDGMVLNGASLYADKETLKLMDSESAKGGDAGTRALERLDNAGKIWTAGRNFKVRVLERGGPMDAVMVEAVEGGEGLKAGRFWIMEGDLLPLNHPAAIMAPKSTPENARAKAKPAKSVRKSDFLYVLNSSISNVIADVDVKSLVHIVAGIYAGDITDSVAKKCLVLPVAFGAAGNTCELVSVTGKFLIYDGVLTAREHFNFALVREASYEAGYDDPKQLYQKLAKGGYHDDDPLNLGALIYVGRKEFTLANGLVKMLPAFQVVNVLE